MKGRKNGYSFALVWRRQLLVVATTIGVVCALWALGVLSTFWAVLAVFALVSGAIVAFARAAINSRIRRSIDGRRAQRSKRTALSENYRGLSSRNQRQYLHLRKLQRNTEHNYRRLSQASQGPIADQKVMINDLLNTCLVVLNQKRLYEKHLAAVKEPALQRTLQHRSDEQKYQSHAVRDVNAQRAGVLTQRLEGVRESRERLSAYNAQSHVLSDLISNIFEQSLTLDDAGGMSAHFDELISQVADTRASIDEVETVLAAWADPLGDHHALDDSFQDADTVGRHLKVGDRKHPR